MCSPFFCNHVISTPFDGVSSMRNFRKMFVHYGENAKIVLGSLRHIIDSKLCDQEGSRPWCIPSGTWVDRRVVCKTRRTCPGGPFAHVHSQRTPTLRINLDSLSQQFGQNGPMSEGPGYAEAVSIRNRLFKKSDEANGRIHPSQQRRQRSHNPFLETSQGSARLDRRTGWEWHSNPSPWTTSDFWWTPSSWDG